VRRVSEIDSVAGQVMLIFRGGAVSRGDLPHRRSGAAAGQPLGVAGWPGRAGPFDQGARRLAARRRVAGGRGRPAPDRDRSPPPRRNDQGQGDSCPGR